MPIPSSINDILCGDVAAGAFGVEAAAEPTDGGVQHGHAAVEAGINVRQCLSVGVVEAIACTFSSVPSVDIAAIREHRCEPQMLHPSETEANRR